RLQQAGIERFTGSGIVDGFAVYLCGARAVVIRLGTAFDFQGVHAHLGQTLNVGDGAQIFRVHDVGAVFVFKGGHVLARTFGFFDHKHAVGWRTDTQGRRNVRDRNRLVSVHDIPDVILFTFLD